eukprot:gb/GECG01002185.1/.p1 GENE.gb/GECG01002185.1/~~gb/GECG01002185.1/.p1  ORF type:complete len:641 (+),score=50.13 gb/GECG01002185.1/:1-1923(+)
MASFDQNNSGNVPMNGTLLPNPVEGIYGAVIIHNLVVNVSYLLRMRVRNKRGWSEFSVKSEEIATRKSEDRHPILRDPLMMKLRNEIAQVEARSGKMGVQRIINLSQGELQNAARRGDDLLLSTHPSTVAVRNCLVKVVCTKLNVQEDDMVSLLQESLEGGQQITDWEDESDNAKQCKLTYIHLLYVACNSGNVGLVRKLLGVRLLSPRQEGIEPMWLTTQWTHYAYTSIQTIYSFLGKLESCAFSLLQAAAAADVKLLSDEDSITSFKATFLYLAVTQFCSQSTVDYNPDAPDSSVQGLMANLEACDGCDIVEKLIKPDNGYSIPQLASLTGNIAVLEVLGQLSTPMQNIEKDAEHPIFFSCVAPALMCERKSGSICSSLQFWIAYDESLLELRDNAGRNLTHICAGAGDIDKLRYLESLKGCHDLWYQRDERGWYTIHYAVCSESSTCVAWLLHLYMLRGDLPENCVSSLEGFAQKRGNPMCTYLVDTWSAPPQVLHMYFDTSQGSILQLGWSLSPVPPVTDELKVPQWPVEEMEIQMAPCNPELLSVEDGELVGGWLDVDITKLLAHPSKLARSCFAFDPPSENGLISLAVDSERIRSGAPCFLRLRGRTRRGWSCFTTWSEVRFEGVPQGEQSTGE